jgi:ABC-type nitrate/sulfonate/bicarbonate transport system permease component
MDDPFWIQIAQYVVPDFMGHIMGNHRSDEIDFFLPPLSDIFTTLLEIGGTPPFINALKETALAFSVGTLSAIVIGVPVGILMGKNQLIDELLLPRVNLFLSAPLTTPKENIYYE